MTNKLESEKFEAVSKNIFGMTDEMRTDKKTQLVGVKMIEETLVCEKIIEYGDIYDMLEGASSHLEKFEGYDLIAVLTAGWAAPNDNDDYQNLPPSVHPERRRVKLVMIGYTSNQTASIMKFDDNDQLLYSCGEGQGALQDAFKDMLNDIGWKE